MSHWTERWIGRPWIAGQEECWDFLRRVSAEEFGRTIPALPVLAADPRAVRRAFETGAERAAWEETARPVDGDAVLMAAGRRPCHVGLFVAPGRVLHSVEGAGAILTPLAALDRLGYRVVGIYRRTG